MEEHPGKYEIVVPSVSILCQPTVALVDEVGDDRGTREVATEYLEYLYSTEAQKIEAENFYRPLDQEVYVDYVSTAGERVITELLADGKKMPSAELEKAVNDRGISSRTMRTAKSRIGDRLVTEKDGTAWVCYLRS